MDQTKWCISWHMCWAFWFCWILNIRRRNGLRMEEWIKQVQFAIGKLTLDNYCSRMFWWETNKITNGECKEVHTVKKKEFELCYISVKLFLDSSRDMSFNSFRKALWTCLAFSSSIQSISANFGDIITYRL